MFRTSRATREIAIITVVREDCIYMYLHVVRREETQIVLIKKKTEKESVGEI